MPNDAKLGMVVGVGLVVFFAVVLFRKDSSVASANIPRAVTPAPRMSGVRGPSPSKPVNRIGRFPPTALRQPTSRDAASGKGSRARDVARTRPETPR